MRVQKSAKKQQPPPKDITLVLDQIIDALKRDVKSDEEAQLGLVAALESLTVWIFPRGDLTNWIPVLDGFDEVLEGLIELRAVVSLQAQPFTGPERNVVLHILRVLKLLLVNCTNRKMFSSYDRLGDLMYSFDLDIIESALLVLIRPAMQYASATPYVNSGEQAFQQHLCALVAGYDNVSSGWEQIRELGWDLHRMATDPQDFHMPPELRRLRVSTQRQSINAKESVNPSQLESPTSALRLGPETSTASLVTPQRATLTVSTPKRSMTVPATLPIVDLGDIETLQASKSPQEVAADLAEKTPVQRDGLFEAIAKIRFYMNLDTLANRKRLVSVRLLALATYCHIQSDESQISTLFIYNPEIIPQLVDLIPFDKGAGFAAQAGALMCLESLAKSRPTMADVLTGLNANVNHGVLFTLIKGTVKRLVQDQADLPFDFVDAVLSMIAFLIQTPIHSTMMISAGILPLLLELLQTSSPTRSSFLPRAAGLLDSLVYSSANAFGLFCGAGGLDVINDRIKAEIDMYLADEKSAQNYDGSDSVMFNKVNCLKSLLRSIHRMMQTSGTAEGLRNLIDSELPKSLKRIYQASDKVGPVVFGQAINILATFVHNEPTSLSTLQELELPQILYDRIEFGLTPAIEVIHAIPNAVGAICLNQTGLDMTLARPKLISNLVLSMIAPEHDAVLSVPNNARGVGAALDELVRHHPDLRPPLMQSVVELFTQLKNLGEGFVPPEGDEGRYTLVFGAKNKPEPVFSPITIESNPVMHHLLKVFGFLEGLVHQTNICSDFMSDNGINSLFEIMSLPCIPVDFATMPAASAALKILRVLVHTDTDGIRNVSMRLHERLFHLHALEDWPQAEKLFGQMVAYASGDQAKDDSAALSAPDLYRHLCVASTAVMLFADLMSHLAQHYPRTASLVLPAVANGDGKDITTLCRLQRVCAGQAIAVKAISDKAQPTDATASTDHARLSVTTSPIEQSALEPRVETGERSKGGTKTKPMLGHLKPLRDVAIRLSSGVGSMMTGIVRAFGRRPVDRIHAASLEICSVTLAEVLIEHLQSSVPDRDVASTNEDENSRFSPDYRAYVLGMTAGLLFEDRATQGTLQLSLYLPFQDKGGIEHLVRVADVITSSVEALTAKPKADRSPSHDAALLLALSNLQHAFSILRGLVSTKSLVDSPQTAALLQREMRESEQKFLPHFRLVQARREILPVACRLWSAPWLSTTPQAVMRAVAQTFLQIMQAQKEEPAVTPRLSHPIFTQPAIGRQPMIARPRVAADPTRIDQVTEMGFTRVQAENALIRARNDVVHATELLLSTPHLFEGPPPAALPPAAPVEPVPQQGANLVDPVVSVPQAPDAEAADNRMEVDSSKPPATALPAYEECLASLNDMRNLYKADLTSRAISLVDDCETIVFDVRSAFPPGSEAVNIVLERIQDVAFVYTASLEKLLAGRLRLLAVLLHGSAGATPAELEPAVLQQTLSLVITLTKLPLDPAPRWLAAVLVVAESLMMQAERISPANPETSQQPVNAITGFAQARSELLQTCIGSLRTYNAGGSSDSEQNVRRHEVFLATLRLLVHLTRTSELAKTFALAGGMASMLSTFKSPHESFSACHPLITIVTRHLVEDDAVLRSTMQIEIKRWINPNKPKLSDATHFLRQIKQVALRNPNIFVDIVGEECSLLDPAPAQGVYHIQGKPSPPSDRETDAVEHMQVDDPFSTEVGATSAAIENDGVVPFLFGEIEKAIKEEVIPVEADSTEQAVAADHQESSAPATSKSADAEDKAASALQEAHEQRRNYVCLLFQLLTELVGSYLPCKSTMLAMRRRRDVTGPVSSKLRPIHLAALINDWVSGAKYEDFVTSSKSKKEQATQTRIAVSSWASSAVIALCADVTGSFDLKDGNPELVAVRKVVIDFIAKAIKDLGMISDESLKYGRLWSLADLVLRLLTSRSSSGRTQDDSALHIAKLMLEKNFVALFTNALAEIDLGYDKVKLLLAMVIKPLEQLSKISIKIGNPDKKNVDETLEPVASSGSESASDEGEMQEESDDLEGYRNSSLAMYTMGASDDEDDEEDDDDSEEIFDEEMGPEPDSDETSEEDDLDDDMDEDMMGNDEGDETDDEGDAVIDVDNDDNAEAVFDFDQGNLMDINEEGLDSEGEDEEGYEGEYDDGEEEGGPGDMAEMEMDMEMEEGGMGSDDEEDDEELAMADMQRFADEVGYELDLSDSLAMFENSDLPSGGPSSSGPWGWVQAGGASAHRSTTDMLDSLGLMTGGAQRRGETHQHPLLAEPAVSSYPHGGRRAARGGAAGLNEMFINIGNLLGQEAAQTLERLVTQGRMNGVDAIRVDIAQDEGGEVTLSVGGRRIVMPATDASHHPKTTAIQSSAVPRTTLQRWLEELNIVHGATSPARVDALVKHVVARLLPAARQMAAEEAEKLKQEEEKHRLLEEERVREAKRQSDSEGNEPASDTVGEDTSGLDLLSATAAGPSNVIQNDGPEMTDAPAQARVTVTIHGEDVDITDSGIDLDFLQALPDEMRADVVEQHMREQARQQQRAPTLAAPEQAPQINSEFLDALPPDIRAEVIQQEALEQARRTQAISQNTAPSTAPAPARFLASLDNDLRDVVLMDQADALLGEVAGPAGLDATRQRTNPGRPNVPAHRKQALDRDAIQLLDRQGVTSLVRLLFVPDVHRMNHLLKVMVNLCQNAKTRADLMDSLLGLLQDGNGETLTGERGTQATPRGAAKGTPKNTPRRRYGGPDAQTSFPLAFAPAATLSNFVAQRCLESLYFIVDSNESALKYFITEHELPAALKKSSRKGKGKDKSATMSYYPLVSLLALFERPALLHVSHILEALTSLVALITKPIASLPTATVGLLDGAEKVDPAPPASAQVAESGAVAGLGTTSAAAIEVNGAGQTLEKAPVIPDTTLRPIVNVMTTGECSSRSFSHTLSLIQNLSHLPDARATFVDELSTRARTFSSILMADLEELAGSLSSMAKGEELRSTALAKFSPASSTQAQLLRVLKTLDFMFAEKDSTASDPHGRQQQIREIYDGFNFGQLWTRLSSCLEIVEDQGEATHVATVLLPLIESVMVVCKYSSAIAEIRDRSASSPMSPMAPAETSSNVFLTFTSKHRKILNTLVRNNPALMSGSFSLLVLNSKVLEFDNKRNWFYQKLKRKREPGGVIQLSVRRQYVFEDSFQMLQRRSGDDIKYGKLSIKFHGEDGVDAGGVTREWYSVLAKQIFDPNFALFESCQADQLTYQPNKHSGVNTEHLGYFKFVGRVIGKAVFDNRLLDAYFSRAFYKQILGRHVDLRDLESIDKDYHKSLVWMLENDITGVVDNDFTAEENKFGERKTVELKPGGAQIPVTQENKEEYVRLMTSYKLSISIKEQIDAFLTGFYEIIPQHLVQIFQPDQLELLISGISTIDVDELKNATQLHGWKNSDPEITWFWRALRSFSQEERAQFLMFVTSSSRVPLGGFSQLQGSSGIQPFQIHKLHSSGALPSAATCFNLLKLGSYQSYESLRAKLLFAMYEGGGFGLA